MKIKDRSKKIIKGLLITVILTVLFYINKHNYLLFHSLIELFSIVIAFAFFAIAWNSKKFIHNGFLLFIGISYFFIGSLDLLHTLAYQGLNIFSHYDFATQFWISARGMESITLLTGFAFLQLQKKPSPYLVFIIYGIITAIIIYAILIAQVFPRCYIDGVGLTPFKIISEYIIISLLIGSLITLQFYKSQFTPYIYLLIHVSIVLTIFSELAFTVYEDAYDIFNFAGHSLKFLSYFLLYTALIETAIREPFHLLFAEIKTNERKLIESNAMKDKFFSILAHDLRNPMGGVQTLATMLQENMDNMNSQTLKKIVGNLVDASGRGFNLLNDLLEWGRSQMNQLNVEPKQVNLRKIIKETNELFSQSLNEKNISIKMQVPESHVVLADENLLRLVIRNLLSNALKFSHPGGNIFVSSEHMKNKIQVNIKDQGVGIPKIIQEKLFRIDVHNSRPGTSNEKGTGLGLVLCKEFVEKNNGEIGIESVEGKGSTFYFTIPAVN